MQQKLDFKKKHISYRSVKLITVVAIRVSNRITWFMSVLQGHPIRFVDLKCKAVSGVYLPPTRGYWIQFTTDYVTV